MTPQMGRYTLQDDIARMAAHVADLDAHTYNPWELLITGQYFSGMKGTTGNVAMSANYHCAFPLIVARAITIDRIAVYITAGGAGGSKARLAIYNNGTNLYPGTLLLDAGEIAADGVGIIAATVAQALTKGLYWLVANSNSTPTVKRVTTGQIMFPSFMGLYTDWTVAFTGWWNNIAYGAYADPFPAGGVLTRSEVPVLGVRVASLD